MRWPAAILVLVLGCGSERTAEEEPPPAPEVPLGPCEAEWLIDEACTGFPTLCSEQSIDVWGNVTAFSSDRFCDGTSEACGRTQFDERGNAVARFDGCGDDPTACRGYLYDDEGRVVELGLDLYVGNPMMGDVGCDDVFEECHRTTYTGEQRTRFETDIGCDGSAEHCTDYEFDQGVETRRTESDCQGNVTLCEITELDSMGRVVSRHVDDGCDGTADRHCFAFEYLGDDLRPSRRRNEVVCGGVSECEDYEYDGLTKEIAVSDCTNRPARCITIETNEAGYLLRSSIDWLCDGTGELCATFTYDAVGNLVSKTEYSGCDDSPHRCETRSYVGECRLAAAVVP